MNYVAPLTIMNNRLDVSTVNGEARVSLSYDGLLSLVKLIIADADGQDGPSGQGSRDAAAYSDSDDAKQSVYDKAWYSDRPAARAAGRRVATEAAQQEAWLATNEERRVAIRRLARAWEQDLAAAKTLMDETNARNGSQGYDPYEIQSLTD